MSICVDIAVFCRTDQAFSIGTDLRPPALVSVLFDRAVRLFCAVSGVQPQSEAVWRQAEKYHVPRLAFVNKLERAGADFFRTVEMMRERLGARPLVVPLPVGHAESFCGVIDLLHMQALLYAQDTPGATFRITDIPAASMAQAHEYRLRLIEELAECDEDIPEKYLLAQ